MRASSVEQIILETLGQQHTHQSSLQIYEVIRSRLPAVNQSTVYRALERLVNAGRVSVSDMGTGAAVYELVGSDAHHHLVCQGCRAVFTLGIDEVDGFFSNIAEHSGYRILTNHLILFGLCPACQQKAGQEAGTKPTG